MAAYRRAVAIKPDFPEAHYNLGNALVKLAKTDEAVATYRRAIAIKPDYADAHDALATALKDANKLDRPPTACGMPSPSMRTLPIGITIWASC